MSTTRLRVRTYECDSLGHVNNAVYIQYLQQATHDAMDATVSVRKLSIEYHAPAKDRDELKIEIWLAGVDGEHMTCGYEIMRSSDAALVARAQIEWKARFCGERSWNADKRPTPLKPLTPTPNSEAKPFHWRHSVRRNELDSSGQVSIAAYFNWLEEATYGYCDQVGWGIDQLRKENFIVLQRRHDAEFITPANDRDEIEIVSRLIEVRRVRGTWIHELYLARDKTLLMRDYSTGAFVDWSGNIKPALTPMMQALMKGEADSRGKA